MKRLSFRRDRSDGQVLVLLALASFVLIGGLALALDVGYLMSERREAQGAADAAALAGARSLLAGESVSGATSAARAFAAANGVGGSDGSGVDVAISGDRWDGTVAVDLQMEVQRFFVGALYTGPWRVSARAVADITDKADSNYILIALDPPGIYVNGSMELEARNGSIISNSNIESSGGSNIITTDGFIDAVGFVEESDSWQAPWGIREKRAPAVDPFAGYTAPIKPTGPPRTGTIRCNPHGHEDPAETGPDCNFLPGYYRNARIKVWDVARFAPGLYYFDNSSIELRGTHARVEGTGVNFYFTGNKNQTYFDPQNGEVYLTAPGWNSDPDALTVHGDYRDLVIWIDVCPGPVFDSQGNQEFFLGGVFYAPCSELSLHGNPNGETVSGIVIGSSIEIKGTSDAIVTYLPYAPTQSYEIYLVE